MASDPQMNRLYRAEQIWRRRREAEDRFSSAREVERAFRTVTTSDWWRSVDPTGRHVSIEFTGRLKRSARAWNDGRGIRIGTEARWAWSRFVIAHELGHILHIRNGRTDRQYGHGPEFVSWYLAATAAMVGRTGAEHLRSHLVGAGVSIARVAPMVDFDTAPLTPFNKVEPVEVDQDFLARRAAMRERSRENLRDRAATRAALSF